jgi:hypothetical protein
MPKLVNVKGHDEPCIRWTTKEIKEAKLKHLDNILSTLDYAYKDLHYMNGFKHNKVSRDILKMLVMTNRLIEEAKK